jgi:hypothetical protein
MMAPKMVWPLEVMMASVTVSLFDLVMAPVTVWLLEVLMATATV